MRRLHNIAITTDVGNGHPRAGAAALEFVVVLPVLMAIVVGAADWGRVRRLENILVNAARVGAAYGATHQFTELTYDTWETRVAEQAAMEAAHVPRFDESQLDVTISTEEEADGSTRIVVTLTYPFEIIIDWPGWPQRINLQRSCSMRGYR